MKKNITLSAEDMLIQTAKQKAQKEHTSLNSLFRFWLKNYVNLNQTENEFDQLMTQISYAKSGRTFSRDERNER